MRNGEVQILIECKPSMGSLKIEHASQLFRYFAVTNARIAVLTNGALWHFYTDLDAPNRMDAKPFLVLDLLDIDETLIVEIQKLSKESFDLESIISAAEELKYIGALKREIASQFREPTDEWIKFFATRVYDGSYTQKVRQQFTSLVSKSAQQFLTERVNDRLKTALGASGISSPSVEPPATSTEVAAEDLDRDTEIETTLEELEGYQIVKAIACGEVKPQRVTHRDAKSYLQSSWMTIIANRSRVSTSTASKSTSACWIRTKSRSATPSATLTRFTVMQKLSVRLCGGISSSDSAMTPRPQGAGGGTARCHRKARSWPTGGAVPSA